MPLCIVGVVVGSLRPIGPSRYPSSGGVTRHEIASARWVNAHGSVVRRQAALPPYDKGVAETVRRRLSPHPRSARATRWRGCEQPARPCGTAWSCSRQTVTSPDGGIVFVEPKACPSAGSAGALAAGLAQTHVGVIAWARTGDPELGNWDSARTACQASSAPQPGLSTNSVGERCRCDDRATVGASPETSVNKLLFAGSRMSVFRLGLSPV
jgi:hypothetical protein